MSGQDATQSFLDSRQYTSPSILQYESVYGTDFVSPGGISVARELVSKLELPSGAHVLDAGCGLGGSAFVMAREFGLKVTGIDLSMNMLEIAGRKLNAHGLEDGVTLIHGDCTELGHSGVFDAIYSRDVFLHIHDKPKLFASLYRSLAPGGRLLFTDYCCGDKPWSDDFESYVSDREYCLHTIDQYGIIVASGGFEDVKVEDRTNQFVEILKQDIHKIQGLDLADLEKNYLIDSWKQKLDRASSGHHRWGLFAARK